MKRIFFCCLLFLLLLPSLTFAQTKMEELGLKGPVKELKYYQYNKDNYERYEFTKDGKCHSYTLVSPFFSRQTLYDKNERILKDSINDYYFDDQQQTFYVITKDSIYSNFKKTGKLDSEGRIIYQEITYDLPKSTLKNYYKSFYTYDNFGNLIKYELHGSTDKPIDLNIYEYDNKNRKISSKSLVRPESSSFTYNDSGFLVSEIFSNNGTNGTTTYTYHNIDSYGNWKKRTYHSTLPHNKDRIETREITYYDDEKM